MRTRELAGINSDSALSDRARPCNPGDRPAAGAGWAADIVIKRENVTFYFPLMTCLLDVLFSLDF
jgi:hypothetical protein